MQPMRQTLRQVTHSLMHNRQAAHSKPSQGRSHGECARYVPKHGSRDSNVLIAALKGAVCKTVGLMRQPSGTGNRLGLETGIMEDMLTAEYDGCGNGVPDARPASSLCRTAGGGAGKNLVDQAAARAAIAEVTATD